MQPKLTDRLLLILQRLIPARLLGRLIYQLARSEISWLKNGLIRGFSWLYNVDTAEAARPVPAGYRSFNDFFTRTLQDGARPLATAPDALVAPADGTIAQAGQAHQGQLLQAKGMLFSSAALLGDNELANELADAHFATIYLAPYNYHRLHMPVAGVLEQTIFIPGALYSVNARTTANVTNLYALNERLVCQFRGPAGRFAMVLVGAMNVASISTAWDGEIMPPADGLPQRRRYASVDSPQLARGEYMGHFNMGSTIVLLGPASLAGWGDNLLPGTAVRAGQQIGTISPLQQ